MNAYRCDFADEEFEIIFAENDDDALQKAYSFESFHGILFNVTLLDDDYFDVRVVF